MHQSRCASIPLCIYTFMHLSHFKLGWGIFLDRQICPGALGDDPGDAFLKGPNSYPRQRAPINHMCSCKPLAAQAGPRITNDFPLPELRAAKGIIKDHDGENWILYVLQEDATPRIVAVPPQQLRLVPETRSRRFDQMAMLAHFKAPSLEGPVPRFNEKFRSRTCPSTTIVEAFYGCNIFPYMHTKLQTQLMCQTDK